MKNTTRVSPNTMNRRNFLKTAAVLAVCPIQLYQPQKSLLVWDSFDDWGRKLIVSKNGFAATFYSEPMGDLRDCHGLCATDEMVEIIEAEIVYGEEGLRRIMQVGFYFNEEEEEKKIKKLKRELRRVTLLPCERKEIYDVIANLRGPHDCVKNYGKSR